MFKEKEKHGFKGGFNLLDTYPVRFCNIVEKIASDGIPETFEFHASVQKVQHVIVNLCPTEPWELPNWVILEHKTTAFLAKLKEIRSRYFPEASLYIGINKNETEPVVEAIDYAKDADWMKVYKLDAKYPQDDPVMLTKVILGIDINFNKETLSQGIVILDAQTVFAVYDNCILGNQVNSRFIALSGAGLKENEIINVQLGTSIEKVLKGRFKDGIKYRVFINGPLRGNEITNFTQKVNWSINSIVALDAMDRKVMFPMFKSDELSFTTNMLGETRRCVYCNYCDDICPVDLEPALYYHSYNRGEKHKARLYNLGRCIECGLCSFICPSKLELLQIIKECKETIERKTTER